MNTWHGYKIANDKWIILVDDDGKIVQQTRDAHGRYSLARNSTVLSD